MGEERGWGSGDKAHIKGGLKGWGMGTETVRHGFGFLPSLSGAKGVMGKGGLQGGSVLGELCGAVSLLSCGGQAQ